MDIAYDHVQEEALSPAEVEAQRQSTTETASNLNSELQHAFAAVSNSPWGSRLSGWFSQARKQGESFVSELQKEARDAQETATHGWTSLRDQVVQRARSLSLSSNPEHDGPAPGEEPLPGASESKRHLEGQTEAEATHASSGEDAQPSGDLSADIVKEAGSLVANFRTTAAARLKDLQKAEDAADEALLKFGRSIRDFLRDAVTITAPDDGDESKANALSGTGDVLFETSDHLGKKVFHSTRLDAQLHAIHTTAASFVTEPHGPQWEAWKSGFNCDSKTGDIAHDLDKFAELRQAMEKLVPEKVDYQTFWMRYYFVRKAIEEEERRRREVLQGAASAEEVAWDDEDDDEPATPHGKPVGGVLSNESTTTLHAPAPSSAGASTGGLFKRSEQRKSHEDDKSVAGSDASYDIVSGATSRAANSPKEEKREMKKDDEEEEDDWE